MEFRLLGPFDVRHEGHSVPIAGQRTKTLLCALLLRADQVVPTDRLIDDLWGDAPPPGAAHALHAQASKLRAALRDVDRGVAISFTAGGYRAELDGHRVDIVQFEQLVAAGRHQYTEGRPAEAVARLQSAEALWRGAPLADFASAAFVQPVIARLEQLHRSAVETRIEAQLACGEAATVVPELEGLAAADPLREQTRSLLMLALYRSGHQARALEVYRQTREVLADELGVDPSPELQQLMQAILMQDPALQRQTATAAGPREDELVRQPVPALQSASRRVLVAGGVVALLAAGITGAVIVSADDSHRTPTIAANVVSEFSTSGQLEHQIPVGKNPTGLAVSGNSLWVTNADDNTVSHIDLKSGTTLPIGNVGDSPAGIALAGGSAWVVSPTNAKHETTAAGTVTPINPVTNDPTDPIAVGQLAGGIAEGGGRVWVTAPQDSRIYGFDPASPDHGRYVNAGTAPSAVAATDQALWVANAGDNTVWKLDPASGQREAVVPVGTDPVAVAVGPSGVWVANNLSGTVTHIDPNTPQAVNTVPVGDGPSAIATTKDAVWVTTEFAGELVRIDFATGRTKKFPVPGAPRAIVVKGNRLFVASATSYQGHRGGRLRIMIVRPSAGSGYPVIDPGFGGDDVGALVAAATTDTLVSLVRAPGPAADSLVPDLAESVPQPGPDTTEYRFQLRAGIKFSTGTVVRASDVRASFERELIESPDLAASPLGDIVGAEACAKPHRIHCDLAAGIKIDDASGTVRFILKHSDPKFLSALAFVAAAIVPEGTPTYHGLAVRTSHLIVPGTGPYRVSKFVWPHHIEMVRNPNFHEWSRAAHPAGYVNEIDIDWQPSSRTALLDLEQGRIDVLVDQDLTEAQEETAITGYPVVRLEQGGVGLREAFLNSRMPPFNNLLARRAINYAIDRSAVVAQMSHQPEARTITCQQIQPGMIGYRPYCPYTVNRDDKLGNYTGPDLQTARRLVRESDTRGQSVLVWAPPTSWIGEPSPYLIARALDEIGYHASVYRPDKTFAAYVTDILKGHAQIGVIGDGVGSYNGGDVIAENLCSTPQYGRYCDPGLDARYEQGLAMGYTNPQGARDLWTSLDRRVTDAAVLLPIWAETSYALVSTRVGNWSTNADISFLPDQLWVR